MKNFRLVVLDYAKLHLDNTATQKALSDLIVIKQKNFERTDPNFVVVDKHDMVGTHFMIYETTRIFEPKLIFALRVTFEDRAQVHKLRTPLQDLMPVLDQRCQSAYQIFKKAHPVIADCNSWFVDPEFSQKTSGLRLSDVGYLMVYLHVKRLGFDHIIGCTNEKYRASRWLENIGFFEKGYNFIHPVVPDPHMMILIEQFNVPYLEQVYQDHKAYCDSITEIVPNNIGYKSMAEMIEECFSGKIHELKSLNLPEKRVG